MKQILSLVTIFIFLSCNSVKNDDLIGEWVVVKKWTLESSEKFKPSQERIMIKFNSDGTFEYADVKINKGIKNTYEVNEKNIHLNFEGLQNSIDADYLITKIDSSHLFINTITEPNYNAIHYIFVKKGTALERTYENVLFN